MQGYGSTHRGIFVQFMTMQEKHLRKEKGSWNLKRKLVVIMQLSKTLYNNNIVIIIHLINVTVNGTFPKFMATPNLVSNSSFNDLLSCILNITTK